MKTRKNPDTPEKKYSFFSHTECEYFPCHDTEHPEDFNCLFCYCPLYALGERCGGRYAYNAKGVKDCTGCLVPHGRESHAHIAGRFHDLAVLAKQRK
jgi:Zn-finger protein